MAGPPCKVIINNMHAAVSRSLETVLNMPETIAVIGDAERRELIQRLANCDIVNYTGKHVGGTGGDSLSKIVMHLYRKGVFTDDVFELLRHPGNPAVPT